MNETDLIIEIKGKNIYFPPFSMRSCTQSLTPISQGTLRRTIGGELLSVGKKEHRKFHSIITCKDKAPPAFDGLWSGVVLKVGCLSCLTQSIPQNSSSVSLEREPVTCNAYDRLGKTYSIEKIDGTKVVLSSGFPGGFITYRPWLTMMVKTYRVDIAEWEIAVGWTLELEEV